MAPTHFHAPTLDDLMHEVMDAILHDGHNINPTKGPCREIDGVLLELENPRARISRTETRGKPYSCLGELCWYLARTNDLAFIQYYLPAYRFHADGDKIYGGYGPRLFDWRGDNQFERVRAILERNPDSRRAVIQLFDAGDLLQSYKDIPCTCTIQFMIRRNRLLMFASMRSNDAYLGLPHDIFCFTMLQEIMARSLSVEVGPYKHSVGSLHLYDETMPAARRFLNEGWQSTKMAMAPMPVADPWPAIRELLFVESALRQDGRMPESVSADVHPYWVDLMRLLRVFRARKDGERKKIRELRYEMSSDVYRVFVDSALARL